MASPSPHLSPKVGAHHRVDRRQSASPPAHALSKKDKRHKRLDNSLQELNEHFNGYKDLYYRQQLHAIQIDGNLILHANPYNDEPLEYFSSVIQHLVQRVGGNPAEPMMQALNHKI